MAKTRYENETDYYTALVMILTMYKDGSLELDEAIRDLKNEFSKYISNCALY